MLRGILILLPALLAQGDPKSAFELEDQAVAQRKRITSGEFEVTIEGWSIRDGKKSTYSSRPVMTLDGDALRCDLYRGGKEPFRETDSWGPNVVVSYTDRVVGGVNLVATAIDTETAKRSRKPSVLDPRMIGMYPIDFVSSSQYAFDAALGTKDIKRVISVEDAELNGFRCKKITRENRSGVTVSIWIDPARDASVVRYEAGIGQGEVRRVTEIQTELRQDAASGRWFPDSYVYRSVSGGVVVNEEKGRVRVTGLNRPVDPERFELAGMDIPPGTGISLMGKLQRSGFQKWDGRDAVPASRTVASTPSLGLGWGWIALATLAAAGAAGLVILARSGVAKG